MVWKWASVDVTDCVCVCVYVRLCVATASRLMKRLGLIGEFQTSLTLTLMNHTALGSACACECEACLSKLVLLFTWDNPEGPSIAIKQQPTTQTWHASFIGLSSSASNTVSTNCRSMDVCARSFVWSDRLICSLTVAFSFMFDRRNKQNTLQKLELLSLRLVWNKTAIHNTVYKHLTHLTSYYHQPNIRRPVNVINNSNLSHLKRSNLPPIISSHRLIQTSNDLSEPATEQINRFGFSSFFSPSF